MPLRQQLLRVATLMALVSVALSVTQCGGELTNKADCAVLLDLKAAAPACLAKVASKDLCGWNGKKRSQFIGCHVGRVTGICLEHCGLTSLPASIGDLTALGLLDVSSNDITSLPASLSKLTDITANSRNGHPGLGLDNNKLTACPSKEILTKAVAIKGNPCGFCSLTPCGTSTSDCAVLLALKKAAPACLANVAPKDSAAGAKRTSHGGSTAKAGASTRST